MAMIGGFLGTFIVIVKFTFGTKGLAGDFVASVSILVALIALAYKIYTHTKYYKHPNKKTNVNNSDNHDNNDDDDHFLPF